MSAELTDIPTSTMRARDEWNNFCPANNGDHGCFRNEEHSGHHTCAHIAHRTYPAEVCGRWVDGGKFVPAEPL